MGTQAPVDIETAEIGTPTADGGYLISAEQLKKLGGGDVKAGRRWLRMLMADEREPKVHRGPTEKPATVRAAGPDDELGILALLIREVTKIAGHAMPIDASRILDHVRMGTQRKGGIVGVIDGPDGAPVGVTVLLAVQSAFSKAYYIQEIFDVVHPDHRKSKHAEDLLKFALWCSDEWSRNFGYPVPLFSSVHTEVNMREKIRFYRRRMNQIGAVFSYPFPIYR